MMSVKLKFEFLLVYFFLLFLVLGLSYYKLYYEPYSNCQSTVFFDTSFLDPYFLIILF